MGRNGSYHYHIEGGYGGNSCWDNGENNGGNDNNNNNGNNNGQGEGNICIDWK